MPVKHMMTTSVSASDDENLVVDEIKSKSDAKMTADCRSSSY